ncbi:MAG TPA: fibronectin type III domain-containing protein [Actinomycetota bacterium]
MLKTLLVALGAIVVLDVLLVGGLAAVRHVRIRREEREIARLEQVWRLQPHGGLRRLAVEARGSAPAVHRSSLGRSAAHPRRRLVPVLVLVAVVGAGTASATEQGRDLVSAVVAVVADVARDVGGGSSSTSEQDADSARATARGTSAAGAAGDAAADRPAGRDGGAAAGGSGPNGHGEAGGSVDEARPVPVAPSGVLVAAASSSSVQVSWGASAGATSYRVSRSLDGEQGWVPVAEVDASVTSILDEGLAPGTTYGYVVVAANVAGESPPSVPAWATTRVDPPAAPELRQGAVTATSVTLEWSAVPGAAGYRLERDGGTGWETAATLGAGVTSTIDAGRSPGVTYRYRLVATNAAGESPSEVLPVTTPVDAASVPSSETPAVAPPNASRAGEVSSTGRGVGRGPHDHGGPRDVPRP